MSSDHQDHQDHSGETDPTEEDSKVKKLPGSLQQAARDSSKLQVLSTPKLPENSKALKNRQNQFLKELGEHPSTYDQWFGQLPQGLKKRVVAHINRLQHGLHAVAPLTCYGPDNCPFINACPIPDRDPQTGELELGPDENYPIGMQCVLESQFMMQKIADYVMHLDVDPGNPNEMAIVNELALIDLKKQRASLILSHGDTDGQGRDLMYHEETFMGRTEGGEQLIQKTSKIHPVEEHILALERRRERWLEKLIETREAKAKMAIKMGNTEEQSHVLQELKELKTFINELTTTDDPDQIPEVTEDGLDI